MHASFSEAAPSHLLFANPQINFARAIEEAKELLDRRAGRDPATHYNPVDFLNRETWSTDMGVDENEMKYPKPPEDMQALTAVDAGQALAWLKQTAVAPEAATAAVRVALLVTRHLHATWVICLCGIA